MFSALGDYAGARTKELGRLAGAQAEAVKREWADQRKGLEKYVGEQMERGKAQAQCGWAQWERGLGQMQNGSMRALTAGGWGSAGSSRAVSPAPARSGGTAPQHGTAPRGADPSSS